MSINALNYLSPPDASILNAPFGEHWYALYTRSRHEKAATSRLKDMGMTTFLPLFSRVHRWSDRRKTVQVSLFPSYTFVRIIATPESCVRVLQTPGVVGFVGTGRGGIPIPDKQIEDIQTRARSEHSVRDLSFLTCRPAPADPWRMSRRHRRTISHV